MAPYLAWTRLGARQFDLALASGRVVQARLARAAASDLRPLAPDDRAEFTRMFSEKIAAGAESSQAAAIAILAWQVELGQAWLRMLGTPWLLVGASPVGAWQKAARAALTVTASHAPRMLGSALAPIARRAHANDRRLARIGRTRSKRRA